jgi:hypothetical protein
MNPAALGPIEVGTSRPYRLCKVGGMETDRDQFILSFGQPTGGNGWPAFSYDAWAAIAKEIERRWNAFETLAPLAKQLDDAAEMSQLEPCSPAQYEKAYELGWDKSRWATVDMFAEHLIREALKAARDAAKGATAS